jgi:hopanoid biosynthesis associated RND transporter like protein HpnN
MTPASPSDPPNALIARLLTKLVAASCRVPWTVLLVSAAIALVSAWAFYTRLEYRTQRSDLMNMHKDYQKRWQAYLAEFGDDDDMVVVVEGADRPRMMAALESLAAGVRDKPGLFDRLFYKVDLRHLRPRALLFLQPDQIRSIQDNLARMGPLLSGPIGPLAWKNLTLVNLLKQARERAGKIDPSAPLDPADEQFLTQLLSVVRSAAATVNDAATYHNPWDSLLASPHREGEASAKPGSKMARQEPRPPEMPQQDMLAEPQYFFSGDGSLGFLLVRPVKEASSFTPALASVTALRAVVAARRAEFPDLQFGLTGMPVLETDEMDASQRDTNVAGYLVFLGVALVYVAAFRGFRYPLLTVAALMAGTFWAMGWLAVTVGHLNILSSAFAVMLIGMGDYGVFILTRYEAERQGGRDALGATLAATAAAGPGILTAAVGTALAFFAATLADFTAVAEFGWIAGCGVLLCALACFTVLPALIMLTDRRPTPGMLAVITPAGDRIEHRKLKPEVRTGVWLPSLARRPRWVLAAGLVAVVILGVFGGRVGYDHNLLHMQAKGLESVRWEQRLIDRTAGASWCALSVANSMEEALALKARYERLPEVSRVAEVASLVPREQDLKLEQLADIQSRLRGLPSRGSTIVPIRNTPREVIREVNFLLGALGPQAPVSPQPILEQLVRSLTELRDHAATTSGAVAQTGLDEFGKRLAGDLLEDLHRLRDVANPARITLTDLPLALRERFVGQSGKWLVQAYARDGLWDIEPLEHFVNQARTVDPEATGKPFGTLEGLRAMQSGFARAGAYALLVIVAVLWVDFRTVRHTLLALAPLAAGAVMTLGVMGLAGVRFNPANMIALPLIVGVGVANGVHVLHDYRRRGGKRAYALAATTGTGVAAVSSTTALGFGMLMIARHKGLAGLGLVLALGVTSCMVAALVFLPAALRLMSRPAAKREARRKAA